MKKLLAVLMLLLIPLAACAERIDMEVYLIDPCGGCALKRSQICAAQILVGVQQGSVQVKRDDTDRLRHYKYLQRCFRRGLSNWCDRIGRGAGRCVHMCGRRSNRAAPAADWPAGPQWCSHQSSSGQR